MQLVAKKVPLLPLSLAFPLVGLLSIGELGGAPPLGSTISGVLSGCVQEICNAFACQNLNPKWLIAR